VLTQCGDEHQQLEAGNRQQNLGVSVEMFQTTSSTNKMLSDET
jgi:hypothetical protein